MLEHNQIILYRSSLEMIAVSMENKMQNRYRQKKNRSRIKEKKILLSSKFPTTE